MSAIPCLSYKRALEEEKRLKECVEEDKSAEIASNNPNGDEILDDATKRDENETEKSNGNVDGEDVTKAIDGSNKTSDEQLQPAKKPRIFGAFTNAKIETVKENLQEQSLTIQQINEYCNNLFVFKNIRVMRFT